MSQQFPLACPDWFDRLKAGKVPFADIDLNLEKADFGIKIYNRLRLPDVPGQPSFGDVGGKWGRDIVGAIFGTLDDEMKRWVREFLILIPKKNSKTTNSAGIMLTALLVNKRPRAEFLLIAPSHEIADTGFSQIVGMIEADPEGWLAKRFQVRDHKKQIVDRSNKAWLKIKTFDNKVMTGVKPAGILVDEIHELGKYSYATKVFEQIRGGMESNDEAFLIMITTQSDEPPTGVFKTELEYARDIRDGNIDGDLLPILYEFPLEMQKAKGEPWKNPKNFHLVHPNLGLSRSLDRLISGFEKAKAKGIEEFSIWASQHLNIQIGIAMHKDQWAGVKHWNPAADPEKITVDSLIERCEVITAGIDGGGLDDMLGLCLTGRDKNTKDWLQFYRGWIQPDALEARKSNEEKYRQFHDEGDLIICEESQQDIHELADILEQVNEAGLFPEKYAVGLDPVGVAAINSELLSRELTAEQLVAVPQGYRLSGIIKGMERRLKDGRLWHDGSNMMIWVASNAKTELRGSALMITKQVSGVAKIDPLIAGFNSFSLMSLEPQALGPSVYDQRGLMMV